LLETRLDTRDFGPRTPYGRLALGCLAYGTLGYLLYLDTQNTIKYNSPVSAGFLVERACILAFMLLVWGAIVVHLLLPRRLRFSEAGLVRRTFFGPHFVPWASVKTARLGSFRGYVMLEMKVPGKRGWVSVPVSEYRRAASLLAEIRRRLPVPVEHAGARYAALLKDG
jgi:hypothetical protein